MGAVRRSLLDLQRRLRRPDRLQPLLSAPQLVGQLVPAVFRAVQLVFGGVGLLRFFEQLLNFFFQPLLFFFHALVTHRLVLGSVSLDFRAVQRHRPQLHQTHLLGQPQHLHKQLGERFQVLLPEAVDGAKVGPVARRQQAQGDVIDQLGGDFARRKHACGVAVDQHFGEHGRVVGLIAPPVALVAHVEPAQVELIDGVGDEVSQMIFGQPIAQRRRQQERLLGLIRPVVCPHVSSFALSSKTFHYFFVFSVGQTPR